MLKKALYALIMLCIVSCGKNERLLTSATGNIYECLVVMPNRPLSSESLEAIQSAGIVRPNGSAYSKPVKTTYDLVSNTMAEDMPGLPQMEPFFTLSNVSAAHFDNYLKPSRNILIVDINKDKYTQVKVQCARDNWSKPQAVYRIQARDDEAFVGYWLEHGEQVREWFVQEELARQAYFYRANTNKDARAILRKSGYDALIPEDYITLKHQQVAAGSDSVEVLWCCNNKGPMRRDIVVYSYPYTAQAQFTCEAICSMRDQVLGQLVTAQVEGSHMGTEYKYFEPQSRQVSAPRDSIGGFYAIETRGLWKILDGEAMGGPFVSLTRLDQVNARVVTIETFLFASGQKKRNGLRQAEAILYTLKMPNEK
ncbi:MAG: DUF4837 family protein [Paludibacteraceae bacterium]|nr:DUF4837 family protein [Paludibacteraceae bacterium]